MARPTAEEKERGLGLGPKKEEDDELWGTGDEMDSEESDEYSDDEYDNKAALKEEFAFTPRRRAKTSR